MSTVSFPGGSVAALKQRALREVWPRIEPWAPILAGLAFLYIPTYWTLANGLWQLDAYSQGPLVLAVALWLFWSTSRRLDEDFEGEPQVLAGGILLAFGLVAYLLGRILATPIFDAGSQLPVVAGVLLILGGRPLLRHFWFPLLILAFAVPPPGFLLDAITLPLKQGVSAVVEQLLYWAGYPVGRNGVVLAIGPYYLLVADACSGLNSIYALCATGVFYLYMVGRQSIVRNAILLLGALPIAFGANVIRVAGLALVTYYFGDEAGQGFVHKAGGFLLFAVALTLFFALDRLLGLIPALREEPAERP
jgi:exosortase B